VNVMEKRRQCKVTLRYMIDRDLPGVLAIENSTTDQPWDRECFRRTLAQPSTCGMVAVHNERVVGYAIYQLQRRILSVLNFAVDPKECRIGIGTWMLDNLKSKLSEMRRNRLRFLVRESNLAACLFLKANGFLATETIRDGFEIEDAFKFVYIHKGESSLAPFLQSSSITV
jgi:[ribosomal protein S18]-alanine N-acetyltransferase